MEKYSFKDILWKSTFQVNFIRALIAGVIWTIFLYITGMETPPGMPGLWLYLFIWPIGFFLFFLPLGLVSGWLSNIGIPYIGLITFIPALMIIPADPVMCIIHKIKPEIIPVDKYGFIEFPIVFWVYKKD